MAESVVVTWIIMAVLVGVIYLCPESKVENPGKETAGAGVGHRLGRNFFEGHHRKETSVIFLI